MRLSSVRVVDAAPPAESLEELYAVHHRRLLRLGTLLLGSATQAEDVVHDVFLAVHRDPTRLARLTDAGAYLRRGVVNGARSHQRRGGLLPRLRVAATDPSRGPAYAPSAEAPALAGSTRDTVLAAMSRLPARQREVLALRYYLDLSEREIAETLGISQGAVKSHASRGIAALRTHLPAELQEPS